MVLPLMPRSGAAGHAIERLVGRTTSSGNAALIAALVTFDGFG